MHLLIPFASGLSDNASTVLRDLHLPHLAELLVRLTPTQRDEAPATSLSPPHERAWAASAGWQGADGALPFAALGATQDGLAVGDAAWGLLTPAHWHLGRDHVTLLDPGALALDEAESRLAFEAVRELFESEGFRIEWGAPSRWYLAHPSLADLPCASLDRAIGRNVAPWLSVDPSRDSPARLVRRLQSEVQLLLYPHPLNEVREQRGALTINSFWLSGCGRAQAVGEAAARWEAALREPLLAEDWAGWAEAWQALDRGPIARAQSACRAGEPVTLTLCGERSAQRFETRPQGMWRRLSGAWRAPAPHVWLEAL